MQFILYSSFIHSWFGWDFATGFSHVLHLFSVTVDGSAADCSVDRKMPVFLPYLTISVSHLPNVPDVSNQVIIQKNFSGAELVCMGQNHTM